MYVSPNFEIDNDYDSSIITPQINEDGIIDSFLFVEQLGVAGKIPLTISEKIDRKRVLLAKVTPTKSMWLYPNGEIKSN
jgi:hypothetical protein